MSGWCEGAYRIWFGAFLFFTRHEYSSIYLNHLVFRRRFYFVSISLQHAINSRLTYLYRPGGLIFWTDFYGSIKRSSRSLLVGGLSMTFYWVCTLRGWFLLKLHALIYCCCCDCSKLLLEIVKSQVKHWKSYKKIYVK